MTTYSTLDFYAPSLHVSTLLALSVPSVPGPSREPRVRSVPVRYTANAVADDASGKEFVALGRVQRLVGGKDSVVAADDTFRISRVTIHDTEAASDPEDLEDEETVQGPSISAQVVAQYQAPHKPGATWTGLASLNGGTIGALSTGRLVHLSTSGEFTTTRVASPLLTLSTPSVGDPTDSTSFGSVFVLAGKEVEVSLWDVERTFAVPSHIAPGDGKRKKDALAAGEVWRAKNLPNNSLSLRPPVHHLCSAFLSSSVTDIVTGTKSGHVRRYDTRQRKPVSEWKVAREGGVGVVCPGEAEHELFFADHSSLLGSLDLRTGKMLYSIPSLTSTPHHLLVLPALPSSSSSSRSGSRGGGGKLGLASISSDATFRLHRTTPPPPKAGGPWPVSAEGKKGGVVGMVGGVGVGAFVFAKFGQGVEEEVKKKEGEEGGEGREDEEEGDEELGEDEEEDIWDGMGEVGAAQDEDEDDEEDEGEEEDEDSDDEPQKAPSKRSRR